jgi:hypothetical protein|tara:strand:+ start:3820 stop:4197 length:378 start_codon:yes stop_codon:yes gene_type:complete
MQSLQNKGGLDMGFCLLAIDGDCAAGAMSEKADFIPLETIPEVLRQYLRNQLERQIEGQLMKYNISPKFTDLCREHHALGNALIDCGIFQHKWHKRTDWIICELHKGQPLNQKGPFNRCSIEGAE